MENATTNPQIDTILKALAPSGKPWPLSILRAPHFNGISARVDARYLNRTIRVAAGSKKSRKAALAATWYYASNSAGRSRCFEGARNRSFRYAAAGAAESRIAAPAGNRTFYAVSGSKPLSAITGVGDLRKSLLQRVLAAEGRLGRSISPFARFAHQRCRGIQCLPCLL